MKEEDAFLLAVFWRDVGFGHFCRNNAKLQFSFNEERRLVRRLDPAFLSFFLISSPAQYLHAVLLQLDKPFQLVSLRIFFGSVTAKRRKITLSVATKVLDSKSCQMSADPLLSISHYLRRRSRVFQMVRQNHVMSDSPSQSCQIVRQGRVIIGGRVRSSVKVVSESGINA